MRKEQLKKEIADLEAQIAPKRKELEQIYADEADNTHKRIEAAEMMKGKFGEDELVFAATVRCEGCGAGMAYPKNIGFHGAWYCSAILLGKAERGSVHAPALPFSLYEIKSENQSSANGATTRPKK